MGWVSQTSYIYGWATGGKPGPGTAVPPASAPPAPVAKDEDTEE